MIEDRRFPADRLPDGHVEAFAGVAVRRTDDELDATLIEQTGARCLDTAFGESRSGADLLERSGASAVDRLPHQIVVGGVALIAVRSSEVSGSRGAVDGADAEAYAKEVVMADFEKPGDSDVMAKLVKDLAAAGKPMEEHTIRKHSERLLDDAKNQVMTEVKA
jgi:hypothetical protein